MLLLIGVPLYQLLILLPQGYGNALTAANNASLSSYLVWIANHFSQFLGYRVLLILAFAILISFPFTLFRIIVAQEILAQEEEEQEEEEQAENEMDTSDEIEAQDAHTSDGMPAYAWRGKGFAVLAAWSGLFSILLYTLGTVASTIYLAVISRTSSLQTGLPANFTVIVSILSIITNTIGGGLLALACLFFGAIIARRGRKLWPGIWVTFGYTALATAALLSGSAVAVANDPTAGSALTTPATLLFALWMLWFGTMLVRLKPEI
ncbi:MAG: hypothetical protein NVSMB33_17580 [Ktedonobacteraceae bacterium]